MQITSGMLSEKMVDKGVAHKVGRIGLVKKLYGISFFGNVAKSVRIRRDCFCKSADVRKAGKIFLESLFFVQFKG